RNDIVGRQLDSQCPEILVEAIELRRSRYRNDPRLLRQQPRESDLGWRGFLARCKCGNYIHQRLVRLTVFGAKARDRAAKIRAVELRLRRDLACQETLAKRTERDESDSQFLQRWNDLLFGLPPEQRILAL